MDSKKKDAVKAKLGAVRDKKKADIKEKADTLRDRGKKRIAKLKSSKLVSQQTVSDNRLELLITTVARNKGEYYADLIQSFDVNMQVTVMGEGTADAKMLSMFGLSDSDKAVIFSVIQGNKLDAALAALDEKFRTIKNGKGIAYTVPLSSIIGTLIFGFLSNNRMTVKENKESDK